MSNLFATVLVVLSAKSYVTTAEGIRHPTGYFLSELAVPAQKLEKAGIQLVFATPGGTLPTMDEVSNAPQWFSGDEGRLAAAREFVATHLTSETVIPLESLDESALKGFEGVMFPGGHAPMEDLAVSPDVARILGHFHAHRKPTALICHGPAALLSTSPFLYGGYRMTAFSTAEERQEEDAGHLDGHMRFYLDTALAERGARVEIGAPWASEAVRDRELITGRNPFSDEAYADLFLEALTERVLERSETQIVIPPPADGYTTIWIGACKSGAADFLARLTPHIALTKDTFAPLGLVGYEVFATPDAEFARLVWVDEAAADNAFASAAGQSVAADAATFMDAVLFKEAHIQ